MMRGCYDAAARYRPQWAYPVPEGYRDEEFIVGPFALPVSATGILTQNLPIHMDDDVPYFIRAIMVSAQIGTMLGNGMLCRIRDCYGNPLSNGLALGLGIWANQLNGQNGFGFVMEPEIECSPGGTMLFDFQAPSNGSAAAFTIFGTAENITLIAAVMGPGGNAFSIRFINPGAPLVPLSVAVVGGTAVQVTLQTDGGGAIISTYAQVQAIINSTPAVQAVMFALLSGSNPAEVVFATGPSSLTGGANGATITLFGTFIGVKRFPACP